MFPDQSSVVLQQQKGVEFEGENGVDAGPSLSLFRTSDQRGGPEEDMRSPKKD